jgi:uncharacterized membrane protein
MKFDPKKMKIGTKVRAWLATAMFLGSPVAAFWSLGASIMFCLVGIVWMVSIGTAEAERQAEANAANSEAKLKSVA